MYVPVVAKYKYKKNGSSSTTTTLYVGNVAGKTESAVLAVLKKNHPNCEIEIVEITWK